MFERIRRLLGSDHVADAVLPPRVASLDDGDHVLLQPDPYLAPMPEPAEGMPGGAGMGERMTADCPNCDMYAECMVYLSGGASIAVLRLIHRPDGTHDLEARAG